MENELYILSLPPSLPPSLPHSLIPSPSRPPHSPTQDRGCDVRARGAGCSSAARRLTVPVAVGDAASTHLLRRAA